MSRWIDADALKKAVEGFPNCYNGWSDAYDKSFIIGAIEEQPSIKPRRGEWIDNGDRYFRCSLCGTKDTDKWHWCHGCGARMKGADDEV